jgi:hypothetical protein
MQISTSPAHIAAQVQRQQPTLRRVQVADLTDLAPKAPVTATRSDAESAPTAAIQAPSTTSRAEMRPSRPGSLVDIKV